MLCFYLLNGCINQENKLEAQYLGLSGPHLARGPNVVHAALGGGGSADCHVSLYCFLKLVLMLLEVMSCLRAQIRF